MNDVKKIVRKEQLARLLLFMDVPVCVVVRRESESVIESLDKHHGVESIE